VLKQKIAWVTGAGTGIGLAGAKALAAAGAEVVMSGRRLEVLEREVAAIRRVGGRAEAEPLDVTDAAAVQRVAETIAARHGRVDILVNSAGLNTTKRFWRDLTVEGWNEVIRINLDGTFYCIQAVLPLMRAQKDGVIINISSWAGIYTSAMVGPAYNSSKHAVVSLTETINMEECVNGIRACAICPAEVATPIMDRRPVPPSPEERARMLKPEDLGEAIRWVAAQPPHACVNEIVISPTWNRLYVGGADSRNR
jgi:NAD(P)-dependent dehydrogenase (short-subunit alcohol dehydrogenase family)